MGHNNVYIYIKYVLKYKNFLRYIGNLLLDILWVGVSDSQVCTQSGQAQGIESARSIWVVPQIVLSIARKMVNLDVGAHLQQLVQARGWLTGIHVN
jgi:hypothetical protein